MGSEEPEVKAEGEDAARERALALLKAVHQFPCEYTVTVIAFNRESVTDQVRRAAGKTSDTVPDGGPVSDSVEVRYEARESSAGKYLSHRIAIRVNHAAEVLELYARLRIVEGVVTIF